MRISSNTKQIVQRFASLAFLFLLIAVLGPFFSYLQTAFGWTNPSATPPDGAGILSAYQGKLGINIVSPTVPSTTLTVDGIISAVGNRIVDVATPLASTDAVNKAYVDAQTGANGSGAIVTLFGVSTGAPSATQQLRPGGAVTTCLRGFTGNGACAGVPSAPHAAGTGTAECTSLGDGWEEVIAGYGPLNIMYTWYGTNSFPVDEDQSPDEAVALSDSICSTASFAYVRDIQMSTASGQVQNTQSYVGACTPTECNTCRICIKSN